MTLQTPWGPAHTISTIATGIWQVKTYSHYGFYLSERRYAQMPDYMRDTFAGGRWYEGNCDANMVICVFSEYWPDFIVESAKNALRANRPAYYQHFYGQLPTRQLVA